MKKILLFMVSLVIFLLSTTTFCFASEFDDHVKAVKPIRGRNQSGDNQSGDGSLIDKC